MRESRGRLTIERIDDPALPRREFPPRRHSPEKFLFPNWEQLFRLRLGGSVLLEAETAPPRVIFGMPPCIPQVVRVLENCLFDGAPIGPPPSGPLAPELSQRATGVLPAFPHPAR